MTTYILQGRYSAEAIKGMIANPEDRFREVQGLMAHVGAKLQHYFVTFGDYDFMTIAEAPPGKERDMMAALLAAAGSGGVSVLKTTIGVTSAEAKTAMEKAKKIAKAFRGAGRKK